MLVLMHCIVPMPNAEEVALADEADEELDAAKWEQLMQACCAKLEFDPCEPLLRSLQMPVLEQLELCSKLLVRDVFRELVATGEEGEHLMRKVSNSMAQYTVAHLQHIEMVPDAMEVLLDVNRAVYALLDFSEEPDFAPVLQLEASHRAQTQ